MQCSNIIAGVWKWGVWGHELSTDALQSLIESCLELGVTSFDHADIYGHYTDEARFGAALRQAPHLRAQMQLISKCGIQLMTDNRPSHRIKSYNTSAAHIIASAETSLRNLATDYLDVLLIHRPDPLLDADEVAEAFQSLRSAGKVLHFGVSNFNCRQFELLQSRIPLVTNQVECSALQLKALTDGTLDQCQQLRIRPMAWSPLGSGKLFAKDLDPRSQRICDVATNIAARYGDWSLDQVLLAWLMQHPSRILPVLGTANPKRIAAAVAAQQLQMTREEWFEIWQASTGHEVA